MGVEVGAGGVGAGCGVVGFESLEGEYTPTSSICAVPVVGAVVCRYLRNGLGVVFLSGFLL
jgi:hypothetical protein